MPATLRITHQDGHDVAFRQYNWQSRLEAWLES
jgi:hypothetical protein